ncbi:MAG: protein kinase [Pseudomonadota bacterium]
MEDRNCLQVGQSIHQYKILSQLGVGGFGITYLAFDEDLQREVAIKECFPRNFVSREGTTVVPTGSDQKQNYEWALGKFLDEATTLAKFKHPGIVQVLQIIKDANNTAYMVLELIEGRSFDQWLKELGKPPSQKQLQSIAKPLLEALEVVHANNFTHRDIAPDNIYVRKNGKSVLLDFGAAKSALGKHSRTLNLVVKDGYSPPEQYYAEGRTGAWTDIYAFAATLYRAITGKRPLDAMARLDAINNDEPDPLETLTSLAPEGYEQGFLHALDIGLSPQMKLRPKDIGLWKEQLLAGYEPSQRSKATQPQSAAQTSASEGASKPAPVQVSDPVAAPNGRSAPRIIAFAALAIAVLAGGYFGFQNYQEAQRAEADKTAWEAANLIDTRAAYDSYLAAHPGGDNATTAQKAISALQQPWVKTFGGPDGDSAQTVDVLPEGGLLVAGHTTSQDSNRLQGWVARLSDSGKQVWTRDLGSSGNKTVTSVAALPDGTALVTGYHTQADNAQANAHVVKLSADGTPIWEREFGHARQERISALLPLSNGDALLAGVTSSIGNGGTDGWLLRINSSGDLLWEKTFGGLWDDSFSAIGKFGDGSVVLAGQATTAPDREPNFWLLKISENGDVIFDRKPGGAKTDGFSSLATFKDGTIVLGGTTESFGRSGKDAIVTLLTADNKTPPKVFPERADDSIEAIATLEDQTIIFAGYTQSKGRGGADGWIVKLSADRKRKIWERVIGGQGWDAINAIKPMADGGLIAVGNTQSSGAGNSDIWVIRLDADGNNAQN